MDLDLAIRIKKVLTEQIKEAIYDLENSSNPNTKDYAVNCLDKCLSAYYKIDLNKHD